MKRTECEKCRHDTDCEDCGNPTPEVQGWLGKAKPIFDGDAGLAKTFEAPTLCPGFEAHALATSAVVVNETGDGEQQVSSPVIPDKCQCAAGEWRTDTENAPEGVPLLVEVDAFRRPAVAILDEKGWLITAGECVKLRLAGETVTRYAVIGG